MHVASLCLDTSGSPLSSVSTAMQRENCSIHGDEGGVLRVGYLNVVDRRI